MPRGKPGSGRRVVARPFKLRWDCERLRWAVIQGARWRFTSSLCIQVTVTTEQGALVGVGVVQALKRGEIVVTA
jgi:hypothetical protein